MSRELFRVQLERKPVNAAASLLLLLLLLLRFRRTGGDVTFTVEVTNTSLDLDVTLDGLQDDPYGDLTTQGNCTPAMLTDHSPSFIHSLFIGPFSLSSIASPTAPPRVCPYDAARTSQIG